MLLELLTQVPLLPIFGEFDKNEISENFVFQPYSISSLSTECNIFEEIVYERINNNYQIVKMKNHSDDFNKKIDLNKSKNKLLNFKLILFNFSIGDFIMKF